MSTETRLTDLETLVAQMQSQILLKGSLGEIKNLMSAVETHLDTVDTAITSLKDRVGNIERQFSSVRSAIQGLNEDGNALKMNLAATTAPAVTDDGTEGYSVGSRWINLTTDHEYVCTDSTTDASIWKVTT